MQNLKKNNQENGILFEEDISSIHENSYLEANLIQRQYQTNN